MIEDPRAGREPVVYLRAAAEPETTAPVGLAAAFLAMFEALRLGPALARGRRDLRAGHVRQLTVSSSVAVALVRGPEEPTAQRARLAVRAFGAAEWSRVEEALAAQARYVADLLAGRMPAGVATVFAGAGLSLVPLGVDEIAMDCTCGSRTRPCTHLAAAIQALAASFDTDPFGAFVWRGRPRDELLTQLRQLRGTAEPEPEPARGPAVAAPAGLGDLAAFWGTSPPPDAPAEHGLPAPGRSAGARADALLDQLDPPPLTGPDGRPLADVLRPAYRAMPMR